MDEQLSNVGMRTPEEQAEDKRKWERQARIAAAEKRVVEAARKWYWGHRSDDTPSTQLLFNRHDLHDAVVALEQAEAGKER